MDRLRQLAPLRRAARDALRRFGLDRSKLRLLQHEHNTTFRVDDGESTFVLRLSRPGLHEPETIRGELAWLRALRDGTELGVPTPVAALDDSLVVSVPQADGADPLLAVLFRWQPGRFVDARLTPVHLRRVAVLQAGLQRHAAGWTPPDGFVRPRVDMLTKAAKARSVSGSTTASGPQPSAGDAQAASQLVARLLSADDAEVVRRALAIVRATTADLASQPGTAGLIHADLHHENVLFHHGVARAIDFDDCGWGFYLYDMAVTLSELEGHRRYAELRDALLEEYSSHLALPARYEAHLRALIILRRLQILMWILESRDYAAFRNRWHGWAHDEIRGVDAALQR